MTGATSGGGDNGTGGGAVAEVALFGDCERFTRLAIDAFAFVGEELNAPAKLGFSLDTFGCSLTRLASASGFGGLTCLRLAAGGGARYG